MSKAFTKDDDGAGEVLVPPRAPLPDGVPNYVTARGLASLRAEQAELEQQRASIEAQGAEDRAQLHALAERWADLHQRIASARLVEVGAQAHDEVRFGATVRVRTESGVEHEYQIVGVDEANAASGRVAFTSPLSRALLGKRVGDRAEVLTPRAHEELEVLEISYQPLTP